MSSSPQHRPLEYVMSEEEKRAKAEAVRAGQATDEEEVWRCHVCHSHFDDPVILSPCGDTVCRKCVPADHLCPECKTPFNPDNLIPSKVALRAVASLHCMCPNRIQGCTVVLNVHDVDAHLNRECPQRIVECSLCHEKMPYLLVEKHQSTTCKNRMVHCSFFDLGCSVTMPQYELADHERTQYIAHIAMLRAALTHSRADHAQVGATLNATRDELRTTRDELRAAQGQLAASVEELHKVQAHQAEEKEVVEALIQEMTTLKGRVDELKRPVSPTAAGMTISRRLW
eukprot:GAFH01002045.1.p1 GENE.GAFH01002045.1~~GAFH01002045.1.p1  ORF type:complete len:301 (-),score=54.45 GAFH01002045.1:407-1261(-)